MSLQPCFIIVYVFSRMFTLGLSIFFKIFVEFKIKIHIRMQNVAFEF